MCAMTPQSLSITFNRISNHGMAKFPNQTVVSAADSSGGKEPISVSIQPKLPSAQPHPVSETRADRKMTTILTNAKTKTLQIHHKGQSDGVKVRLHGHGTPMTPISSMNAVPTQAPKQTGYIITPSGASAGENISINGGGLVIRARNDKSQTITAKSTPDNQLQVQVGQGKSAVQLSIQVTPQGSRGEVELRCVRNVEEEGQTTGYTVSVKRPEDESRACKQHRCAKSPRRSNSPTYTSTYSPRGSKSPRERSARSPERDRTSPRRPERTPDQRKKSPERRRSNATASREHSHHSYGTEARAFKDEAASTYPTERPESCQAQTCRNEQAQARTSSPMKAPNQLRKAEEYIEEYDPNLHYKRKLDTHHHKPTISYLIARRMTELFKEMRKTAELHQPPPFIKF